MTYYKLIHLQFELPLFDFLGSSVGISRFALLSYLADDHSTDIFQPEDPSGIAVLEGCFDRNVRKHTSVNGVHKQRVIHKNPLKFKSY
jgi:hypothetical protein